MNNFIQSLSPICNYESGVYDNPINIVLDSPYNKDTNYYIKYNTNQLYDLSNLNDGHEYTKPIKISRTTIFKYIGSRDGLYRPSYKESKIFVLDDIKSKTPIAFIGSCLAKGLSNRCCNIPNIFEILIANNHTAFLLNDCYINKNKNICGYSNSNYGDIFELLKPHTFLHSSPFLYKSNKFILKKEFDAIEGFYEYYRKTCKDNKFYVIINGPVFDNNIKSYTDTDILSLKHNKFYKVHAKCFQDIKNKNINFISIVDFFVDLINEKLIIPTDIFDYDQNHYTDFANTIILYWFFQILNLPKNYYSEIYNKINNDKIIKFIESYNNIMLS